MTELYYALLRIVICMGVRKEGQFSVSSCSRWLRDNPGKATVKWRWRDGQTKGGGWMVLPLHG